MRVCSVADCSGKHKARGLCDMHYRRVLRPRGRRLTIEERFWPKVDVRGPDECWEWQAHRDTGGYGRFRIDHRAVAASRTSWTLANGPIPDGLYVLHRCDNPPCVNPAHLFLGTHRDNCIDAARKSRLRGSGVYVGPDVVRAAVAEYRAGKGTQLEIAARYGVSATSISSWLRGRSRTYDAGIESDRTAS